MTTHRKTSEVSNEEKALFYKRREEWRMAVMASPARMSDKACAFVISSHISHKSNEAFPSQATIATELNTSEVTVQECIRRLCALGFLTKRRGGFAKPNRYEMAFPPSIPQAGHGNGGAISSQAQHGNDATSSQATQGNGGVSISQAQPVSVPKHSLSQSHAVLGPNLKDNLKGEPTISAAHQAPAPTDRSVPGSTTPLTPQAPASALRAAGAASGVSESVDPELVEIVEGAEVMAHDEPSLLRADYDPSACGIRAEDAELYFHNAMDAAVYRKQASDLRKLLRSCGDPDARKRAERANVVLLNKAEQSAYVAKLAKEHRPTVLTRSNTIHDENEVPF